MTAGRGLDRVALVAVLAASLWFAFAAVWGMFGIPGGGHLGAGSAVTTMATEQMIDWHLWYPAVNWYSHTPPTKDLYYCHHPFGPFYNTAVGLLLFGHHDFVIHLAPVLQNICIPPLLYGIAKERWGRPIGAVAACAYVVVPIAVGFSNYDNMETPTIFGALLFFWGHSRHETTSRRRYLVASLAGLLCCVSGEWTGYLIVGAVLAWALLRAFVLPRRVAAELRFEPYARWWAICVALATLSLVWWLGLFWKADKIGDWLASAEGRGGGGSLSWVLKMRAPWIDFSFTPIAIALGKAALPVAVVRLIVLRRDVESYSLALLFGAVCHYVAFRGGADVHVFWSHYFAPYYALGVAQLAVTVRAVIAWALGRFAVTRAPVIAAWTGLAVGLLPSIAILPDGVRSLAVWRRTGGRYDDHGTLIRSHIDMLGVLRDVVKPVTPFGTHPDVHPSASWGWEHEWTFQEQARMAGPPSSSSPGRPWWIARASGLSPAEQLRFAGTTHVRVYGDTWLVDQSEAPAPLDAYSLHEREPSALEWFLYGGTEPMRDAHGPPDPWLTWEWRTHLGQDGPAPTAAPSTLDEQRIAHNIAVARGDAAAAETFREKIESQLDRTVSVHYDQSVNLIGVRVIRGVEPRIQAWFESTGPMPCDCFFAVHANVLARAPLSSIPPNPTVREVAWPSPLPAKLWRPGFLYEVEVVMNHLIGVERYAGYWASRDGIMVPRRRDGAPDTVLAVVQ